MKPSIESLFDVPLEISTFHVMGATFRTLGSSPLPLPHMTAFFDHHCMVEQEFHRDDEWLMGRAAKLRPWKDSGMGELSKEELDAWKERLSVETAKGARGLCASSPEAKDSVYAADVFCRAAAENIAATFDTIRQRPYAGVVAKCVQSSLHERFVSLNASDILKKIPPDVMALLWASAIRDVECEEVRGDHLLTAAMRTAIARLGAAWWQDQLRPESPSIDKVIVRLSSAADFITETEPRIYDDGSSLIDFEYAEMIDTFADACHRRA